MRKLPTFYYLTHFYEFLEFVEGPCASLLHPQHHAFLNAFHQATKAQQCTLVRCINRKTSAVKISSLRFAELPNIAELIEQLIDLGWLAHPAIEDMPDWLNCLTKDELYEVYCESAQTDTPTINKSAAKSTLLRAFDHLPEDAYAQSMAVNSFVMRKVDPIIDYFLFLYFGNTKSRLNQFSLRDLGVMNTREEQAQMQARFDCKDAALSSFMLSKYLSKVRRQPLDSYHIVEGLLAQLPKAQGAAAQEKHNAAVYELATGMLDFNQTKALSLLKETESEQAQEKWCREAYKVLDPKLVQTHLEKIIDNPISDRLLAFAEDFLARKYQQKRTSILTDMLREGNQHLQLDEVHKGGVERGVIAYYAQQEITAYRTENTLWRSLFGLVFWQELFETPGLGLATEFDVMPMCLKKNNFYQAAGEAIHLKLDSLKQPNALMRLLHKNATQYYGKRQGIFHWRSDMLAQLSILVEHLSPSAIMAQLLRMSQDWQASHDGFPDIMVLEAGKLRFEEIKGEGDVLRRNQLSCIKSLRDCGFDVRITTVDFIIDPNQPYVVVDIETTGGRAGNHKITEIGMVKMQAGKIIERWQSLINPQRRIPSNITALTGIDNDMVKDAPIFADVADEVEKFTQDCIFVAHNVNFDYGFIKQEFAQLERFWRRPKLCTVQQMRKYYKGIKSYSLANLTRHFEIDMERHHRAMSDAVAASELLNLINEKRFSHINQANMKGSVKQAV
ncbi:exonuclease domain-containing protein [Glaciecola sp. SC05]|uniref:exonuclease domain-containing protein n=1 Tax=Glaciecola sp. SC05 TaxID=1987355 RepID=UPI0035274832